MSATKIHQPVYKVYEPGYHPHRTIILDEQIESPETLTIRLEEEAARNGGDLSGGCPPGLLPMPMSAYKAQPAQLHGYADSDYSPYPSQSFSQQTENAASQLNQIAFAANNAAAGQYLATQVTTGANINILSCHPSRGPPGTKVSLKATCQYDLVGNSVTASPPFVSLVFGSQRCSAQVSRDSRDANGVCTYTLTAEAPQFLSTGCPSFSNVPVTLLLENGNGDEMTRVGNVGVFSYLDVQSGAGAGAAAVPDDSSPPDLGSPKTRSPVHRASPPHQASQGRRKSDSPATQHGLPHETSSNTYGFSPSVSTASAAAQIQSQSHAHADFSPSTTGAYNQGSNTMLSSYRAGSFTDHYPRNPSMLRSPHGAGWMFGNQLDPLRAPNSGLAHNPHSAHNSVSRSILTPLQHQASTTPQLIRTSTLAQPAGGFPGYGVYQEKATLKIAGDLSTMAEGWSQEEWESKRRLVLFRKQQTGSVLTVSFKAVSAAERPPHSICISCIWWEEKQACYVTSVDTIHLLEQLLAAPNRFGVDEKNRIRRNLEGFRPATVSKARSESEEFFKVIMGFGNPKPRNIEKDVKVFHWKDLSGALYKIISKYSASTTTNVMTPTTSPHVATTMGLGGSYPALPPTPVSTTSSTTADPAAAGVSYAGHHHADSLTSPRTLSGGPSSWGPTYGPASKAMSPALKTSSPGTGSSLRLSTTLPVAYDHRGSTHSVSSVTSPYGLSGPSSHHTPHSTHTHHGHSGGYASHSNVSAPSGPSRNWESYSVADGYQSQTSSGHSHGQVYGSSGYGEGPPRA
ncbi:hypothetical protein CHGG_05221 [Chaetomium globosum CBS 148.51]|uniref:DUF7082 domain-containing protein n=1 Tax=Chaetomium globosum (strain ATCC 6205 / CBS 148.51 / DSM 1962 / NBRC 6347 / NRRL 1970) TaxID=306901 RepID=Q2GZ25_CHAGB|nr:uncharacterized protein CHGG_05221 [Chaetomium globosum CBS 148.51]EAQ88602.1 hypothetical protein CHGG_05221 [Chaetomium globosum CBS 148.51]